MADLVALLRGVNVGGITVRSADLKALFVELGYADARTYVASGNVRFTAEGDRAAVKERIERALGERFGYEAWIVLASCDELRAALAAFPFDAADAARQPYIVFCADGDVRDDVLALAESTADDPVAAGPGVVFWHPPKGASVTTPFAKELARPRWKAVTTTRNIRTVAKIVA
ncbi:DUF1697 domain-containing protein [Microbacterium gilvum]|uniref:DUF1697 domain-containing protein n=1 Tax=Microbacterium gilvum TaxID=1336204 RepID=A0ABP9AL48_9MICO